MINKKDKTKTWNNWKIKQEIKALSTGALWMQNYHYDCARTNPTVATKPNPLFEFFSINISVKIQHFLKKEINLSTYVAGQQDLC